MADYSKRAGAPPAGPHVLTAQDHSRDAAGMTYVYPVVSRRSGGVSVGINLNPNNACNWRCIYCQVPGLVRGAAPPIDLDLLERELRGFLQDLVRGDFMQRRVPEGMRRLNDIAFSGNGEPTSAREFEQAVARVAALMGEFGLTGKAKLVLITNGSLMSRAGVQRGLARMAACGGEVWFKLDRATAAGMRRVNGTRSSPERVRAHLEIAARLCPTWVQTCVFALDGEPMPQVERAAYLDFLRRAVEASVPVRGVMLYGLARPSMQPEAARLARVERGWLDGLAREIAALGLAVKVSE